MLVTSVIRPLDAVLCTLFPVAVDPLLPAPSHVLLGIAARILVVRAIPIVLVLRIRVSVPRAIMDVVGPVTGLRFVRLHLQRVPQYPLLVAMRAYVHHGPMDLVETVQSMAGMAGHILGHVRVAQHVVFLNVGMNVAAPPRPTPQLPPPLSPSPPTLAVCATPSAARSA